jgi:hypothetical protein
MRLQVAVLVCLIVGTDLSHQGAEVGEQRLLAEQLLRLPDMSYRFCKVVFRCAANQIELIFLFFLLAFSFFEQILPCGFLNSIRNLFHRLLRAHADRLVIFLPLSPLLEVQLTKFKVYYVLNGDAADCK